MVRELSIVNSMIKQYPKTDLLFHAMNDEVLRVRALGSILHLVQDSYAKGHTVRCMVRNESRLEGRPWVNDVAVVTGDVLQPEPLCYVCKS